MDKATVYLFTSPTCPHCPAARRFIDEFKGERDDFLVRHISVATSDGQRLSRKFNVQSVPTFIIKGPAYPSAIGLMGLQSSRSMHKYIDLALGRIEEPQENPSFLQKIRNLF